MVAFQNMPPSDWPQSWASLASAYLRVRDDIVAPLPIASMMIGDDGLALNVSESIARVQPIHVNPIDEGVKAVHNDVEDRLNIGDSHASLHGRNQNTPIYVMVKEC